MSRSFQDGKHWWRRIEPEWIGDYDGRQTNRRLRRLRTPDHLSDVASELSRQPLDEDFLDLTLLGLINEMPNISQSITISTDGTFTISGKIMGWGRN